MGNWLWTGCWLDARTLGGSDLRFLMVGIVPVLQHGIGAHGGRAIAAARSAAFKPRGASQRQDWRARGDSTLRYAYAAVAWKRVTLTEVRSGVMLMQPCHWSGSSRSTLRCPISRVPFESTTARIESPPLPVLFAVTEEVLALNELVTFLVSSRRFDSVIQLSLVLQSVRWLVTSIHSALVFQLALKPKLFNVKFLVMNSRVSFAFTSYINMLSNLFINRMILITSILFTSKCAKKKLTFW